MKKEFAELSWRADDVQTLRPAWSLAKCEEWLCANEKYVRDRLCELGWDVMESLLPAKTQEDRLADIAEKLSMDDDGKGSFCEDDVTLCVYVRDNYSKELTLEEAAKVRKLWSELP